MRTSSLISVIFKCFCLTVLSTTVFSAACTKKADQNENAYIASISANVKGIDPAYSSDIYASLVVSQVYEGLYGYHYLKRPYTLVPAIAEGFPAVSKDGLTYTIKLRSGVRFQDDPCFKSTGGKGREVVAGDFIYSWKRLLDPTVKSENSWVFEGVIAGLNAWRDRALKEGHADYSASVEGLSALDEKTLVVKLTKPLPSLVYRMAMQAAFVLPAEAVNAYGPEIINHPVGTGPFMLKEWVRNSKITLIKNPNHRVDLYPSEGEPGDREAGLLDDAGKQLPFVDKVVFLELVEDQPRWLNFMKGVTYSVEIPKDSFDLAIQNKELRPELAAKGMKLYKATDLDITYYAFNMEDPVVGGYDQKKKYLRQAISLTFDSQVFGDTFFNGRFVPAVGPIPPGLMGYDPGLKNPFRVPDLEKAKALLAKAGYPGGKGLPPITFEITNGATARQGGELFKAQAEKLGIQVALSVSTWPEFTDKIHKKKAQVWGMSWTADYPDADNFLQLFYSKNSGSSNGANYKNPEFDKLYEKAMIMPDSPERTVLYKKMVLLIQDDVPWIYNIHRQLFQVAQGWVRNYKPAAYILATRAKHLRIDAPKREELLKKL